MINGYSRIGIVNKALALFREMQKAGVESDEVTMLSVMYACSMSGAFDVGEWIHAYINKHSMNSDLEINTALVNMYAKYGCIEKAKEVFETMPVKDSKAWSSMIVGLAIHGLVEDALETFARMGEAKVEPNHVTYVGVLSAFAHGGLVSEGRKLWLRMLESGIEPSMEHYGCMVDLFCRANLIEESCKFVESMTLSPNPVIWRTLLVGCRRNKVLDKGEIVAKKLLELEPHNAENYNIISSLYALNSDWEKMSSFRKKMKDLGIKAAPGCSSIEVDGFVHEFVMGDWSHRDAMEIRGVLKDISERVSGFEHEPWISDLLHNVGDEEKADAL